jgi:hypothetical protein
VEGEWRERSGGGEGEERRRGGREGRSGGRVGMGLHIMMVSVLRRGAYWHLGCIEWSWDLLIRGLGHDQVLFEERWSLNRDIGTWSLYGGGLLIGFKRM